MDFYEVLRTRRSIRKFTEEAIPQAVLERVMLAAGMAPSGSNRQNWKYIIVSDPELREKVGRICLNQKFISEAPLTVIVCGRDMSDAYNRGGYMEELGMIVDASITFTHFIMAARAEGLGTCWIGLFDNEQLKNLFGIPDGWDVVALSPLGYPSKPSDFVETEKRKSYDELVSENYF